jgi:hypothetical protein
MSKNKRLKIVLLLKKIFNINNKYNLYEEDTFNVKIKYLKKH